jgi:hypothetical protein
MTHEEHLSSTEWNPWLQDKSRRIISDIASALCDMSASATAAASLRQALYNACKIYVHTLEMETRKDLQDLHAKMTDFISAHPDQADALLEATRSRALQP